MWARPGGLLLVLACLLLLLPSASAQLPNFGLHGSTSPETVTWTEAPESGLGTYNATLVVRTQLPWGPCACPLTASTSVELDARPLDRNSPLEIRSMDPTTYEIDWWAGEPVPEPKNPSVHIQRVNLTFVVDHWPQDRRLGFQIEPASEMADPIYRIVDFPAHYHLPPPNATALALASSAETNVSGTGPGGQPIVALDGRSNEPSGEPDEPATWLVTGLLVGLASLAVVLGRGDA